MKKHKIIKAERPNLMNNQWIETDTPVESGKPLLCQRTGETWHFETAGNYGFLFKPYNFKAKPLRKGDVLTPLS